MVFSPGPTERRERALAPQGPPPRESRSLLEADPPGAQTCQLVCPTDVLVLSRSAETSPSGSLCPLQRCSLGGSWDTCFSRGCCVWIDPGVIITFGSPYQTWLSHLLHPPSDYFCLSSGLYLLSPWRVGSCREALTDQWKVMSLLSRWSAAEAVSRTPVDC